MCFCMCACGEGGQEEEKNVSHCWGPEIYWQWFCFLQLWKWRVQASTLLHLFHTSFLSPFLPSNKLHHHPGGPSGGAHDWCHVPQSRKERAAGGCGLIGAIHESSVLRNFWAPFGIGGSELYSDVHTGLWFGYALWIKKKLQSAI